MNKHVSSNFQLILRKDSGCGVTIVAIILQRVTGLKALRTDWPSIFRNKVITNVGDFLVALKYNIIVTLFSHTNILPDYRY